MKEQTNAELLDSLQDKTVAEAVEIIEDADIRNVEDDEQVEEYAQQMQAERAAMVEKQTNRYMRKNAREIKRLRAHAEKCLLDENKEGYIYAVGKLRKIIGKEVSRDVLETMYETSLEEVVKIIQNFQEAKSQQEQ
ncbi:hypothetical protein VPHD479_0176 [Vibrio phage D479]